MAASPFPFFLKETHPYTLPWPARPAWSGLTSLFALISYLVFSCSLQGWSPFFLISWMYQVLSLITLVFLSVFLQPEALQESRIMYITSCSSKTTALEGIEASSLITTSFITIFLTAMITISKAVIYLFVGLFVFLSPGCHIRVWCKNLNCPFLQGLTQYTLHHKNSINRCWISPGQESQFD